VSSWGDYGAAIRRWEHVIGRQPPAPTDEKGRLNVPFVEWMMGFDAGWVDQLSRTTALRCLGNAVVQQQGELALRMLLEASA
jgi:DNA (cytosine-5)-methyltransferase 1